MKEYAAKREISTLMNREPEIERLLARIEDNFQVIVFGGAVRDVLFNCPENIRDIDVVLYPKRCTGNEEQEIRLREIIRTSFKGKTRKNRFGGYKVRYGNTQMDIWLLKDTWAFRQNLLKATPENLLKSVYLNIDAYALNYCEGKFIANCGHKKIEEIDIVLEENPCEELNLVRAVVFQKKYHMCLSENIIQKLTDMMIKWSEIEDRILKIEKQHYGAVVVTMKDIENAIKGV